MQLIENARNWWRLWSQRLNAVGLALLGWFAFDPVATLYVWNAMPHAVRDIVPPRYMLLLSAVFFALAMIARMVKQPKLEKPSDS